MASEASATLQWLCTILSFSVILSCIILKVPQIISVFRSQSVKGINFTSVMLETFGYSIMLTYHFAMGYPLTTYFEYTFLVLQDLILFTVVLHYTGRLKMKIIPGYLIYVVVCYCFAFRLVPDFALTCAIGLAVPISISSKLMQIFTIISRQDPGQVSAVTWGIAFYTTMARSVTTLYQTGDLTVLTNFALSCFLNLTLTSIVLYYRTSAMRRKLY